MSIQLTRTNRDYEPYMSNVRFKLEEYIDIKKYEDEYNEWHKKLYGIKEKIIKEVKTVLLNKGGVSRVSGMTFMNEDRVDTLKEIFVDCRICFKEDIYLNDDLYRDLFNYLYWKKDIIDTEKQKVGDLLELTQE